MSDVTHSLTDLVGRGIEGPLVVLPERSKVVLHGLPDLGHRGVVLAARQLAVLPPALVQVLHLRGDHPRALGLLRGTDRVP